MSNKAEHFRIDIFQILMQFDVKSPGENKVCNSQVSNVQRNHALKQLNFIV